MEPNDAFRVQEVKGDRIAASRRALRRRGRHHQRQLLAGPPAVPVLSAPGSEPAGWEAVRREKQ